MIERQREELSVAGPIPASGAEMVSWSSGCRHSSAKAGYGSSNLPGTFVLGQ